MASTEKFIQVNTCVAVDFPVEIDGVLQTKELLSSLGSIYNNPPHLTLLLMPATEVVFEAMKSELHDYLRNLRQIKLRIIDMVYEIERRFLQLQIEPSEVLTIHSNLLTIATKYRKNELRQKDIERIAAGRYSDVEVGLIERYGFVYAGENFNCHITIGDVPKEADIEDVLAQTKRLLANVVGHNYLAGKVNLLFHTDAASQSEMKVLWKETIALQG